MTEHDSESEVLLRNELEEDVIQGADKRKRKYDDEELKQGEASPSKRRRAVARGELQEDPLPMNIVTEIRDGVRYLAPYWTVYRTRTKGRWLGRKLVEVFAQEFLSVNKNYPIVACKLGRFYVNDRQMLDVDYVLKNGDSIVHWGHRHEHPAVVVDKWTLNYLDSINLQILQIFISVRDFPLTIIEETDDLLVVNKPPSLPVHPCGQYAIHTVLGQLRYNHNRSGLRVLHRLDRTTSGVLLFAKNYETDAGFKKMLKDGCWSKEYVCMVEGVFPDEEIECNQPIGVLVISMGIQCVRPDGKTAHSRFKKLWSDGKRSVLSVYIHTGRTHQIRVHAQYLGYPIVGDQIYNSDVWGPLKGKGAEYGKSYEELCNDVSRAHRCSNWHETVAPDYESRMERMANEELTPEPADLDVQERPTYDPICLNCNVTKKEIPRHHFQLYLHCLKYSTEKWSYSTPLPDWAINPGIT